MLGSTIDKVTSGRLGDPLVGLRLLKGTINVGRYEPLYYVGGFYNVVHSTFRASYRPFLVAEQCMLLLYTCIQSDRSRGSS